MRSRSLTYAPNSGRRCGWRDEVLRRVQTGRETGAGRQPRVPRVPSARYLPWHAQIGQGQVQGAGWKSDHGLDVGDTAVGACACNTCSKFIPVVGHTKAARSTVECPEEEESDSQLQRRKGVTNQMPRHPRLRLAKHLGGKISSMRKRQEKHEQYFVMICRFDSPSPRHARMDGFRLSPAACREKHALTNVQYIVSE